MLTVLNVSMRMVVKKLASVSLLTAFFIMWPRVTYDPVRYTIVKTIQADNTYHVLELEVYWVERR